MRGLLCPCAHVFCKFPCCVCKHMEYRMCQMPLRKYQNVQARPPRMHDCDLDAAAGHPLCSPLTTLFVPSLHLLFTPSAPPLMQVPAAGRLCQPPSLCPFRTPSLSSFHPLFTSQPLFCRCPQPGASARHPLKGGAPRGQAVRCAAQPRAAAHDRGVDAVAQQRNHALPHHRQVCEKSERKCDLS